MALKVGEKLQLLPKDEIKYPELIKNLTETLNLWFLHGAVDDTILKELFNLCADIILCGLKEEPEKLKINTNTHGLDYDASPTTSTGPTSVYNNMNINNDPKFKVLHKIIDDFESALNEVSIRRNLNNTPPRNVLKSEVATSLCNSKTSMQILNCETSQMTIESQVAKWLMQKLSKHNLCDFLYYLVTNKELLEEHYAETALLRQEKYVRPLVIVLRDFKTNEFDPLSQIDSILKADIKETKHDIIVPKSNIISTGLDKHLTSTSPNTHHHSASILRAKRKSKSLSEFTSKQINSHDELDGGYVKRRPRCKTIGAIGAIPQTKFSPKKLSTSLPTASSISPSLFCEFDDNQPSTSQASSDRSKFPLSKDILNSNKSNASSLISTSISTSISSSNSNNTIQLINTDDIKIWRDHSWELKQKNVQQNQQRQEPTAACAIPTTSTSSSKSSKSRSPLNSFLSSLFSTPPSHTSWFVDHDGQNEQNTTETAIESLISDNNYQQNHHSIMSSQPQVGSLSLGSTVFDKFLPTDGKKLRSRISQNFFDNTNTTLNCSDLNIMMSSTSISTQPSYLDTSPGSLSTTPKNYQSLTRFLKTSHLSHNNTELEKENAHFRISEALISAMEHIKWNKLEAQKDKQCREATPLATDCLAPPDATQGSTLPSTSSDIIEGEHIPYAELEEVSNDLLSAEIVGLSLISKFDEKQLPKVSELKWLVSDDDTPQKLLPMPDVTSSANPDDHVIHSATRGTQYWAPPRQQIIFTDHPPISRKEQLKKQNYLCAGCGMRVSAKYMRSFRYCTYLGKYHCTGCHRNQISAIPAKILQYWDFKHYPVSVFAYRLLEQMYSSPLFYVCDLNPALYIRSKRLLSARYKRLQLKFVKDFICMCRFALREQSYFQSVPKHITDDIENWSMSDFFDAQTKCLHRSIDGMIERSEAHILNCVLCRARGFWCEYCHNDVVIYPWNPHVERCDRCGTCSHKKCWKSMGENCFRCQRIDKRHDEINDDI